MSRIRSLAEQIDLAYVLDNLPALMTRSREGLKRIQKIVKDLRDFVRLDEAELKEADLNENVRSTADSPPRPGIGPRRRARGGHHAASAGDLLSGQDQSGPLQPGVQRDRSV